MAGLRRCCSCWHLVPASGHPDRFAILEAVFDRLVAYLQHTEPNPKYRELLDNASRAYWAAFEEDTIDQMSKDIADAIDNEIIAELMKL
jgi:hypothetical protein